VTRRRLDLGASGETATAAWYVAHGYDVLDRNWRCPEGELDLVLRRGGEVVFCEVKTRSSLAYGSPLEAVGPVKQRRLRILAVRWLDQASVRPVSLRFDVAGVLDGEVEVIEAAF